MTITIIMMGKNKEKYIDQGVSDFQKKLKPFCRLNNIYLKEDPVSDEIEQVLASEVIRIQKAIPSGAYVIVLDEHGKSFSSISFAKEMQNKLNHGESRFCFIIGSSHGIHKSLKEMSNLLLSFSSMTMSHQIARLILLEQLYRMFTIQRGKKYHY